MTFTIIRIFEEVDRHEFKEIRDLLHVIAINEYKIDAKEGKYKVIIAGREIKLLLSLLLLALMLLILLTKTLKIILILSSFIISLNCLSKI